MMDVEQNYHLLKEIDANRQFLLLALQSNPALLEKMDERMRQIFAPVPPAPTFWHPVIGPDVVG